MIEWGDEPKHPSKCWGDDGASDAVPDEEHDDVVPSNGATFPGDAGMGEVGDNGGDGVRDDAVDPKEVVVFEEDASEESVEGEIEDRKASAGDDEFAGVFGSVGMFAGIFARLLVGLLV